MESHERMQLLDRLMEEVTRHIETMERALTAQDVSLRESQQDVTQGTAEPKEHDTLQAEKAWWEKAHHGLTIVKNAFEQIEPSERQRGVIANSAGAGA